MRKSSKKYQKGGKPLPMSHSLDLNYGDITSLQNTSKQALTNAQAKLAAQLLKEQFQKPSVQQWTPKSNTEKVGKALANPVTALEALAKHGNLPENYGDRNILDNATDVLNPAFYGNAVLNTATGLKELATNPSLDALGRTGAAALPIAPFVGEGLGRLKNAVMNHPLGEILPYVDKSTLPNYMKAVAMGAANDIAPMVSKTPILKSLYKKAAYNVASDSAGPTRGFEELTLKKLLRNRENYVGSNHYTATPRNLLRNYIYGDNAGFESTDIPLEQGGLDFAKKFVKGDMKKYQLSTTRETVNFSDAMNAFKRKYNVKGDLTEGQAQNVLNDLLDKHGKLSTGAAFNPTHPIDDIAGHTAYIYRNAEGNPVYKTQDLWKFEPGAYNKKWMNPDNDPRVSKLADRVSNMDRLKDKMDRRNVVNQFLRDYIAPKQASLMHHAGTPFALMDETPIVNSLEDPVAAASDNNAYEASQFKRGGISTQGYKSNSPDRFRDFNIIPSNQITMKNVKFPVFAQTDTGEQRMMMPGEEHIFPNAKFVKEFPMKKYQAAGIVPPKNPLEQIQTNNAGNPFQPIKIQQQENPFKLEEPAKDDFNGEFVSSLDYNFLKNPMTASTPTASNGLPQPPKERKNLNYLPIFASAVVSALGRRVEDRRQQQYTNTNLSNPFNYIPLSQNEDYGVATYAEGGFTGDDSDDEFLWEPDVIAEAEDQREEVAPVAAQIDEPEEQPIIQMDTTPFVQDDTTDQGYTMPTGMPSPPTTQSNFDLNFDDLIVKRESGGDYTADNPNSSAVGKYQFLWKTWKPKIQAVTGVTSEEDFKKNPTAQENFWSWYKQNEVAPAVERLKKYNNKNLSDTQLAMLYHFKGEGGTRKWLTTGVDDTAENNTPIENYLDVHN